MAGAVVAGGLLLLAHAGPVGAAGALYRIENASSELTFTATSRLVNADGRFHRFAGEVSLDPSDVTTTRLRITVDAASIDTDNQRRDDHLRHEDFFWVERHPAITFESVGVEGQGGVATVTGRLTLRGVTREIIVPVEVNVQGGALVARGRFDVRRFDYGLRYQSWLNPVGDVVRVAFTLRATRSVQPGS